jgi:four helix bundle protein
MVETVRNFRELRVWQIAIDLVPEAYRLARCLPHQERFVLSDQIRRAAVSVPANIAEGQARQHTKEFLHHLSIARGSLAELQTLMLLAERLSYISCEGQEALQKMILDVRTLLSGLIRHLQNQA